MGADSVDLINVDSIHWASYISSVLQTDSFLSFQSGGRPQHNSQPQSGSQSKRARSSAASGANDSDEEEASQSQGSQRSAAAWENISKEDKQMNLSKVVNLILR